MAYQLFFKFFSCRYEIIEDKLKISTYLSWTFCSCVIGMFSKQCLKVFRPSLSLSLPSLFICICLCSNVGKCWSVIFLFCICSFCSTLSTICYLFIEFQLLLYELRYYWPIIGLFTYLYWRFMHNVIFVVLILPDLRFWLFLYKIILRSLANIEIVWLVRMNSGVRSF